MYILLYVTKADGQFREEKFRKKGDARKRGFELIRKGFTGISLRPARQN